MGAKEIKEELMATAPTGDVADKSETPEICFIRPTIMAENAKLAEKIRQPWEIMDHLMLWNRETSLSLALAAVKQDVISREKLIYGDLVEMKEVITKLENERGVRIRPFYGEAVPDVGPNRSNAIECYKLLTWSRRLVEEIHDIFRRSDTYAQIRYDFLPRRGQREYCLNGEVKYFAMTPKGLELFREFLKLQYTLKFGVPMPAAGETSLAKNDILLAKLRQSLQMNQLTVGEELVQTFDRLEEDWRDLMLDAGLAVPQHSEEAGESMYSMFQFERMMAERRGEDWHNWL